MKILSTNLMTELNLRTTRPGYLVQLEFSSILYLSTMGDISWDSKAWTGVDIKVAGIGQDGSGGASGTITLGNTNGAYGALVLNEGASDIPVKVYAIYANATSTGDPVEVFSGVIDGATIDSSLVTLTLVSQGNSTLYSPRVFINKASGFNFLQPVGTKILVGSETFILER